MSDEPARLNPDLPRVYSAGGLEMDYFVRIYCSDRGQHKPVPLTTARRELDGMRGMNHALMWFDPPATNQQDADEFGVSRKSYAFRCPKCPRNPKIDRDRWWTLIDSLAIKGVKSLDLSLLTF